MNYPEKNIKIPLIPENNLEPINENFHLSYEQSPKDDFSQMDNCLIKRDSNDLEENNFISHETSSAGPNNIFFDNDMANKEENIFQENENFYKDGIMERDINSNVLQKYQHLEHIHIKTTTFQYDTINGKKIIIKNDLIKNKFQEKFNTTDFNIDDFKDMQFLRIKSVRRTNAEIEKTKQTSDPGPKKKKNIGRKKKDSKEVYSNEEKIHGKDEDGNMIKKLNSSYLERIRNWMNKSFVDDKLNFLNENENQKKKQNYFIKLEPQIINNSSKRK